MITTDNETYVSATDVDGCDYFCPARVVDSLGRISSANADTCVEAEVAGRYAGLVDGLIPAK